MPSSADCSFSSAAEFFACVFAADHNGVHKPHVVSLNGVTIAIFRGREAWRTQKLLLLLLHLLDLRLERRDLRAKRLDDLLVLGDVIVDVDHVSLDLHPDVLGPVGVLERVERVLVAERGRAHGGDHHRSAVAAQRVLEETSQLAVTVRNVHFAALLRAFAQGVDTVAQRQK
jgi:hypothetical protein